MQAMISEDTMIRLLNSVVRNDRPGVSFFQPITTQSTETISTTEDINQSNDSMTGSCRICRWNRSDLELTQCPCSCRGSVGYVHLTCLKRWILHRRNNRCEICNQIYDLPKEKTNCCRMFCSFFSERCFGAILKNFACSISLIPLANIIWQQVLNCMERINQSQQPELTVKEVTIASFALLTSSAIFFHFFEYMTIRFMVIRNILSQWWMFGNSEEYEIMDLSSNSVDSF